MKSPSHIATVLLAACISHTTALAQEDRGTPEQQAACAPDAFRLCSSYIPDPARLPAAKKAGSERRLQIGLRDPCDDCFDWKQIDERMIG